MASTISASTLTLTTTETISLNGTAQGSTNTTTVSSVNEVMKRIVTVEDATNGTILYQGGAAAGAGTFISENVVYIRITNLDDTNHVTLSFTDESAHYAQFRLGAGRSFILNQTNGFDNASDIDSTSGVTITKIEGKASSADVDCEIMVCSS